MTSYDYFILEMMSWFLLMVTAVFVFRITRFQKKMEPQWHTLRTTAVKNPLGDRTRRSRAYMIFTIVLLIVYMVLRTIGIYQYAVLSLIFAYFTYSSIFMMMRQTTVIRMNREGIYLADRMVEWEKVEYYEWKKDRKRPSGVLRLKIKGRYTKVGFLMDTQSKKNVAKVFEKQAIPARGMSL